MPPKPAQIRLWKSIAGYGAFALFSLVFFFYLTFPYDAVKQRAVSEAAAAGWTVTMASLGPGFFGVTAGGVRVSKAIDVNAAPPEAGAVAAGPPESLMLKSVSLRPSLIPLGVAVRANALGGKLSGSIGGVSDLNVSFVFDDLDPSQGNMKAFTGLDLTGRLNGELNIVIPNVESPGSKVRDYDIAQSNGSVSLQLEKLQVKGGTITVPLYGQMTPLDLPRITLGDIDGHVKVEKGLATLDKFHGKGEDVELLVSGTLKLNRRPDYSELNMELKVKADPEFVKRLGIMGSGLSMLPMDKTDPSFRAARVNGFLGRPNFIPGA